MDVQQASDPGPGPDRDIGDNPILLTGWMTRAEVRPS